MTHGQTALQRRAREYLERRPHPVDALELAREVLGLSGGPPEAARHLVETLLGGCPGFVRDGPSGWRYAGLPKAADSPELPGRWLALEAAHWTDPAGRRHLVELAGLACPPGRGAPLPPRLFAMRPDVSPPEWDESARPLAAQLAEIVPWLEGAVIVSYRPEETLTPVARALAAEYGLALEVETLSLRGLARRWGPAEGQRGLEELAAALGLFHRQSSRASDRAALAAEVFQVLRDAARTAGHAEARALLDLQAAPEEETDFGRFAFDRDWLDALPERPGIYRMTDREGALLYVGKARDLRARLRSYFRGGAAREEREARILERLHGIEIEECGSEILALLAEDREIRQRRPLLNVQREVHPRTRAPQRAQNLAALLPAAEPAEAVFLFFRPPDHLSTLQVPREGELPDALARELRRRVLQLLRAGAPEAEERESGDPGAAAHDAGVRDAHMRIASSWLALHRDRLPTVDLSAARGEEHALALLDRCRRAPSESAPGRGDDASGVEYR